jgi:hypothetical protein
MTAVLFYMRLVYGISERHYCTLRTLQLRLPRSLALHHLRGAGLMQPARIKRLRTIVDEQLVAYFEWNEIVQNWNENLIAVALFTAL